ncbi:MAG: MlaE family lipid ABC transporter permease subunit [Candidatus Sumerlaeota bacterium]|nr:MlaE family lipid ABC transporter permease subunit [Candidatus Sumerlaeota bacterium]
MNVRTERQGGGVILAPEGRLDAESASEFLAAVERELRRGEKEQLRVDVGGLEYIDSAGAAVLIEGYHRAKERGRGYTLRNLTDDVRRIFALTEGAAMLNPPPPAERKGPNVVVWIGQLVVGACFSGLEYMRLAGQTLSIIARAPFGLRRAIRWNLTWLYMERTGWDAIPIVATIALLTGTVLALQSAVYLQQYSAAIYVADLVGISMTREMGPLLTAVIVAGRSGSAFAAEIGTMKVNEEIDALRTMGLSPIGYLVVPKFVALTLMMPCLVILANSVGILGGFLIGITSMDQAPNVYLQETILALHVKDVVTGLIKSVVFAMLIAATGCYRGFEVEGGADGVGRKTTSAVVTAIFLVIVADAVFTALFYMLERT